MNYPSLALLGLLTASLPVQAQQISPLLASPDSAGIVLRWTWPEGERPAGYFVERRAEGESEWTRLNATQPLLRSHDRAAARNQMGAQWDRYQGLLFPDDPRAERADPESFRGMLLLAADVEPAVARLLGLRYDDRGAQTGARYEYRLVSLTSRGEVSGATSGVIAAGRYEPAEAPGALQAAPGPQGLALHWDASGAFSAFAVYRSGRRDGEFVQVNTAPVVVFFDDQGPRTESAPTFFTDLSAPRGDSVFYQVAGLDAFGRLSRRSDVVGAAWRDPLLPAPPRSVEARGQGDTVVVSWLASEATTAAGYQLWTAANSTGPFERLGEPLPLGTRAYHHAPGVTRRPTWYRVTARDGEGRDGDASPMAVAELPDLAAPPVPSLPAGIADTGRLRIDWAAVPAADLLGYRVYRGRTPGGAFVMLNGAPRRDTTFTDTIPVAADQPFYYRVTAVDSAFNESAASPAVVVRPPDVTAPGAPRLTALRRGAGSLTAEWLGNPEPDVTAYRVLYREQGAASWLELRDSLGAAARSAIIAGLAPGRRYEVSLIADDDAGNRSSPAPARVGEAGGQVLVAAPELRRATWDRATRSVVLEWAPLAGGPTDLLVLRREQGGTFRPVGSPDAGTTRFADGSARPSRRYEYALSIRAAAGEAQSRPRSVTVPGASQ